MSTNVKLIRVITIEQIQTVVNMANVIWKEHYTPIIGEEQVSYMLRHFQSVDAIKEEMKNRSNQYYLIYGGKTVVGYIGIKIESSQVFLSKIYVLSTEREKGIAWKSIDFIKKIALAHDLKTLFLTVNRNNTRSIAAYQKIGFKITGERCQDIGEGYVMDDFTMELKI